MLKEKDIYMLGIGILEIMTGKISKSKLNLSLDNVPDCWASFSCCTTLIQVHDPTNKKHKPHLKSIR
jgi:hypothetical protein